MEIFPEAYAGAVNEPSTTDAYTPSVVLAMAASELVQLSIRAQTSEIDALAQAEEVLGRALERVSSMRRAKKQL